jgi:hypothetical protein
MGRRVTRRAPALCRIKLISLCLWGPFVEELLDHLTQRVRVVLAVDVGDSAVTSMTTSSGKGEMLSLGGEGKSA